MQREAPVHVPLHLVSDSTGETVTAVARAVTAQYARLDVTEHPHPLVRSGADLDAVLPEIARRPGIVLYTLVSPPLAARLEDFCRARGLACLSVLAGVQALFRARFDVVEARRMGAQHTLDASYFQRIEAMTFAMAHDDGRGADEIERAELVLIGVSRSSKTPTAIYLANRGVKVANVPFLPAVPLPRPVLEARRPLIVGLVASAERIAQVRANRLEAMGVPQRDLAYVDRHAIAAEIAALRRLCRDQDWPILDVSRRAVEETAAEILTMLRRRAAPDEPPSAGVSA